MRILKDDLLQKQLDQDGYVVLELLSDSDLDFFLQEYHRYKDELPFIKGVHITTEHAAENLRQKISSLLINECTEKFSNTFLDFKLVQGNFFIKSKKNDTNSIAIHRDWTIVDERIGNESFTLWVALCDVSKEMGTIGLIKGSHKDIPHQKHIVPKDKYTFAATIDKYAEDKIIQYFELKAGQAILWNHKILHNSLPNYSEKDRINMNFLITNKAAQLKLLWYQGAAEQLIQLTVPDNFYQINNTKTLSEYYASNTIPYNAIID